MKILDRYIVWNFSRTFILCCLIFVGIYSIFDLLNNFDGFIGRGGVLKTITSIGRYYFFHSFAFLDSLSPLLFLIASIVLLKRMNDNNEIIALTALGVNRERILRPLALSALFFSLAFFFIREVVVPFNLQEIVRKSEDYFLENPSIEVKPVRDMQTQIRVGGGRINSKEKKIIEPVFTLPPGMTACGNKITASEAYWYPQGAFASDFPAGWLIKEGAKPAELAELPSLRHGESDPIVLLPKDHPKVLSPGQCYVKSQLPFLLLEIGEPWAYYASTRSLIDAVNNPSLEFNRNTLQFRVHNRMLRPVLDLIPFFICIPLIFFRTSQNVTKKIYFCMLIAALYIGMQYASSYFIGKVSPVLAVWLPIIIFFPFAVGIYRELVLKPHVLLMPTQK